MTETAISIVRAFRFCDVVRSHNNKPKSAEITGLKSIIHLHRFMFACSLKLVCDSSKMNTKLLSLCGQSQDLSPTDGVCVCVCV